MLTRAKLCHIAVAALVATGALAPIAAADRIAYQGRLVMGSRGVVVMSGAGENPVELPHPAGSDHITPALSPDGAAVAYAAKAGDAYKLWMVRLADDNSPVGEPKQLTTGNSDDEQPAWSPDGTRIAYVSGTGDNHALVTIPAEGGSPTMVAALGSDFRNACPHWSPDSSRIVFSSGGKLFIVGADGGDARQLVDDGMYPSWSPDGTSIAFFQLRPEPALSLISPGGGETRALLSNVEFFGETVWSPDGKYVAFKADKVNGVQGSLWVAPAAGGPAKPLRSYGVAHGYLDWSGGAVRLAAATTPAAPATANPTAPRKLALLVKKPAAAQPVVAKPAPTRGLAAPTKQPAGPKVAAAPKPPAPIERTAPAPPSAPSPVAAVPEVAAKPPEAPAEQPPVRIVSPADGAVVRGLTKITVSKDMPGGYVSFFVDGAFGKATVAPFEMDWDTPAAGDGPHTVLVTAYGAGGGVEGTAQVRVEVRNSIAEETLPQEGVTLRYRFKPKEKWEYEVKVQAQAGAKGEVALPVVAAQGGSLDALVTQRVEAVKEVVLPVGSLAVAKGTPKKGAAAQPAKPVTLATVISQVRTGRLDAPGTGGRLPQVGRAARSLRSPEGAVAPVVGPAGQPIAVGNLSIVFPPQAVKLGDKWTAPMTILPVLRSDAVARVTAEHRVDGVQWENGVETIRIVSTFKAPSLPLWLISLDNVTGKRTTWFAYKEHQVVRMEDSIQGTFNQKAAIAAAQAAATASTAGSAYGQSAQGATTSPYAGAQSSQAGSRVSGLRFGFGSRRSEATTSPRAPQAAPQNPYAAWMRAPTARQGVASTPGVSGQAGTAPSTAPAVSAVLHYTLNLVQVLQK